MDVVEIAGRHTQLKKAGKRLQGVCPLHKEKTGFKCDPRWFVSALYETKQDVKEVQATRWFFAGVATRNPYWIAEFSTPHEDLWMLSHGPELPGADRGILTESVGATPFVVLRTGERYIDGKGKMQTVPRDKQIAYGVYNAVVTLDLVRIGDQWKVKPDKLLDRVRDFVKAVDQKAAKSEYRRKLTGAELDDILQGAPDMKRVEAFFKANHKQSLKDEAMGTLAYQAAIDGQLQPIKKNSPRVKAIRFLAEQGASPNATSGDDKDTPLIYACMFSGLNGDENLELVRVLLELGANPAQKNASGKSALDHLKHTGAEQIRKALEAKP